MTMEKGAVPQLLYQLYTALNRKKKRNLTGTAMETMTAPATKVLAQAETQQYQNVCLWNSRKISLNVLIVFLVD